MDRVIKKLSEMGSYHNDRNGENQDVICSGQNNRFCVISLADGVSACKEAKCGAEIASSAITNLFLKKGGHFLEYGEDQVSEFALCHVRYELKRRAEQDSEDVTEYSSTLASVLVDKKKEQMLCFSLGDSIIMATGNGKCKVLLMPSDSSDGCCVTTTRGASAMVTVKTFDTYAMDSVMICSDGAWRHLFKGNRLRPEAAALLENNAFDELRDFLMKQECFDDYSFIILDLRNRKLRRKSA